MNFVIGHLFIITRAINVLDLETLQKNKVGRSAFIYLSLAIASCNGFNFLCPGLYQGIFHSSHQRSVAPRRVNLILKARRFK